MRILLLAYEFPPIQAAQSLRWYYLSNALASLGVEVDVLTVAIDSKCYEEWPLHSNVKVYRCFPGPFVGFSSWLRRCLAKPNEGALKVAGGSGFPEIIYRFLRKFLDQILIPDVRTEWLPFAWLHLKKIILHRPPDLLVSSHEPGVDLILGLLAKRKWNLPWIADLGDPVLAPYTPSWRRTIDCRLEKRVCHESDSVVVTTDATAELLYERHQLAGGHCVVVSQGFPEHRQIVLPTELDKIIDSSAKLDLLYTGTFYKDFRNPEEFLKALAKMSDVRLVCAGNNSFFDKQLSSLGEKVLQLGNLKHSECLALQARVPILLSIGNKQLHQVPGKIFEYLGAGRPILHIFNHPDDPVKDLIERTGRGLCVVNEDNAIADVLEKIVSQFYAGILEQSYDLSSALVTNYSWNALGENLLRSFQAVVYSSNKTKC